MTYILTAQLYDENTGEGAFARYQAYLASVRDRLPPGAYALATSNWYWNSNDHRAPHDAWLIGASVAEATASEETGRRNTSIVLRLLGAYHDGQIELRYADVTRYRLELQPSQSDHARGHRDWRHDEFRLAAGGRVEHEIEWWGRGATGTWLIEAADVEYRWLPAGGQGGNSEADA
jgi:hypothetical protein